MGSAASPLSRIPAASGPLPPGTQLGGGRYVLGEILGRGGFGITYEAVDRQLGRDVAIKELFPEGARRDGLDVHVDDAASDAFARARERFLREATSLARFGQPNIVRVFAVVEEHGTAYIVLERLSGQTLAAEMRARQGPFTEAEALGIAADAASALMIVHRAGLLHRDVSPSNLMRTSDGRIVLIDFGLARAFDSERTTNMTRILTPGYAPPEQYEGRARFAPRADVYALGATLYRLLSGRIPPPAAERVDDDALVALWRLNATVSHRVSDAVQRALSLDAAARPASIRALLDDLGLDTSDLDFAVEDHDEVDLTDTPTVLAPDHARDGRVPVQDRIAGPSGAQSDPPNRQVIVPAPVAPAAPAARIADPAVPADHPLGYGRPPKGRGWLTLPLAAAGIALASAQPVSVTLILGLVVAPILATVGDRILRRHRRSAWIVPWGLRNLAVAAGRSIVPLIVLVAGLGLWALVDAIGRLAPAGPWVLRATGVATGWILVASIGHGSPTFRSHVALDALVVRLMPRGRITLPVAIVILACGLTVAACVLFEPEPWPISG